MKFAQYHGLGKDDLIIHPFDAVATLEIRRVQRICDRNYGVGQDFRLRIMNPL